MRGDGDLSSSISKAQHKRTTVESRARCDSSAPAVAQCDSNSDALFLNCKGCAFYVYPCMPDGTFSIYFGFFYLSKWERGSIWEGEAESGSLIGWNLPSVTFSRFNQILSEHLQLPR